MDFLQLAKSRYSCRKFQHKLVSHDLIDKILEAAKLAPSACNNQPIKVLVLESEEAKEKIKRCTSYHFDAPLIFIVCYDNKTCWYRSYDNKSSGDIDASIATTHMILEAFELGIGSTWVMSFDPNSVIKEFSLDSNIIPVSIIPMGYPADDCVISPKHDTYKDMKEIVKKI